MRAKPKESMAPLLLPFLLLLSSASVQAQQNITKSSSLTPQGPNSFWLSPSGDFAFGFRPIEGNSSSYLLAVWFNKTSDQTVAWYAKSTDPDPAPIQVSSGSSLQLTSGGMLSLSDTTGTEVWNSQVVGAYASMLDTGNFVLAAADGSTKWETFNNPADTILLTQVLTTPKTLRSRIIATDYSNGRFLLNLQANGVFLYPVAVPSGYQYDSYWSMAGNTTKLVFDATGRIYISFDNGTQINMTSGGISSMADYYHRATLDPDGVFRQYVYPKKASNLYKSQAWSVVSMEPPNICEALLTQVGSGACGFNSYCTLDGTNNQTTCVCPEHYSFIDEERKYKGCKPDFQPQSCDLDEAAAMMQFQLTPMTHVDWPLSDYEQYSPITQNQCQQLCLGDCFCAVAVFRDSDSTCWKKKMPLSNGKMGASVQRTVFIKVAKNNSAQSELVGSSKWKKDKKYWILGSSLFLGSSVLVNLLLISVLLFGTYCTITRKKVPSLQSSSNLGLPLKAFTYAELENATSGFQEVLGTGASGIVYKGNLQDEHGTCIAVKKIDKLQHETEKEFTVEVQTIGRTYHKNLVRLLGFCNEGKERLLVYEFMTNGSLNRFLFGDVRLQWNIRVQLALGVARGLLYLHEECSSQIIHCDIKPQNILLDDSFTAKISDFGLAKLLRTNQTQTNTGIRGTRGYVAPEWFKNIGITAKVDVYSFGVILLELICCRRNVEFEAAEEEKKILTYWANDCYRCGRVDFLLEGDDEAILNLKKVERFVAVALWCLQEDPTMRPTMLKVTQMLDGAAAIPTPPDSSSVVSSLQ
ncbi:G-type lectin S-receptor-like serine/threonine-protein kinase LECRK4 [Phragmites australis]|uniref:G-type lectin S-receptor-like serine/threonine-protein kinase LECRK4 n=1 Tax=Phragmites australis TaxID=29695 RepID=UPI002D772D6A|nr:G-type lectin S-receptor-like serine/threonine-protein kinase LECRK4 [Phragmites australis]